MYVTMIDFLKQYKSPDKETIMKNAINDIIHYKKKQYGKRGYDKKINQLVKQLVSPKYRNYIKPGNLSQYIIYTRVKYRDTLKQLIDKELQKKKKKSKKTKRKHR
tara:strand:- start:2 stop:316 length:315 start_codon:yes stop_codon:yes gene_type:complete